MCTNGHGPARPVASGPIVLERLGLRSIVLVGMPGAGKTSIGRRLAARLSLPFRDADAEIEEAAGMSIPEFFATHGEPAFRDGEVKVIARLLGDGPQVLATGGGALTRPETRENIARCGVSIWLKADIDVLFSRVKRRNNRPLLAGEDPRGKLQALLTDREPTFSGCDLTVLSADGPHEDVVEAIVEGLAARLAGLGVDATQPGDNVASAGTGTRTGTGTGDEEP